MLGEHFTKAWICVPYSACRLYMYDRMRGNYKIDRPAKIVAAWAIIPPAWARCLALWRRTRRTAIFRAFSLATSLRWVLRFCASALRFILRLLFCERIAFE